MRRTVMALLPELAAFFPAGSGELFEPAMWFLIHTLRKVRLSWFFFLCFFQCLSAVITTAAAAAAPMIYWSGLFDFGHKIATCFLLLP